MLTRVPGIPFDRLSPDVYADAVSTLLSREVHAQRSDGRDGGHDCFYTDDDGTDVYSLKSFTGRMTSSRRRQVMHSLSRSMKAAPRSWTLVVPIDPTPAELDWFLSLQHTTPAAIRWLGRTWLEETLARHPDVATYLHNITTLASSSPWGHDADSAPIVVRSGHAFLSYVREDTPDVDLLQRALESARVRVWRDTADLWPGEDWRAKIRHAITNNALVFIACFSHQSLGKEVSYQNEELNLAIDQLRIRQPGRTWLIPVRFDDCEIPDLDLGGGRTLASIQRADLFGDRRAFETARLIESVKRILIG